MNRRNPLFGLVLVAVGVVYPSAVGCSSYQVPGGAADFRALGITDVERDAITEPSIAERLAVRPAASFPATIASVRVQELGYRSYSSRGRDVGGYSIVSVREVERDEDYAAAEAAPEIDRVIPLNWLVASKIQTEEDLREAAARVQADMLFVYTFDTRFGVETTVPALGVITLGLFPNDEARVTSTAAGALIDTRTGYIYAVEESTATSKQLANAWTNRDAVDQSRRRAEREAFEGLLARLGRQWQSIVRAMSSRTAVTSTP